MRRSKHLFAYLREGRIIDLAALFQGTVQDAYTCDIHVVSLLDGRAHLLSRDQANVLLAIPSNRWVSLTDFLHTLPSSEEDVRELTRKGLVLSSDSPSVGLERKESVLESSHWDFYAAIYHSTKRWRDIQVLEGESQSEGDGGPGLPGTVTTKDDSPPSHFYSVPRTRGVQKLSRPSGGSELYRLLLERRSRRSFDSSRSLALEHVSTILYFVFGCHGILAAQPRMHLLKKTSPSGGGLHPIEAYLLVRDVDGLGAGLYHYSVEKHALEFIEPLEMGEAADLGYVFAAGQAFARSAHLLLLLTARFDREFWKYREHAKAYGVLHMDVGHLSQSVYLVCAKLGLGACITGAINDANIVERLGLDGITQGTLAVIACGVPDADAGPVDPVFQPYLLDASDAIDLR